MRLRRIRLTAAAYAPSAYTARLPCYLPLADTQGISIIQVIHENGVTVKRGGDQNSLMMTV